MKCGNCGSYEGLGARLGCDDCRAFNLAKVNEAIEKLELEWGDEEVRVERLERKKKEHAAKRTTKDWMKGL